MDSKNETADACQASAALPGTTRLDDSSADAPPGKRADIRARVRAILDAPRGAGMTGADSSAALATEPDRPSRRALDASRGAGVTAAEISTALATEPERPSRRALDAHLEHHASQWSKRKRTPDEVEAASLIKGALRNTWHPEPGEDPDREYDRLASALIAAAIDMPGVHAEQLAGYFPCSRDAAIAAIERVSTAPALLARAPHTRRLARAGDGAKIDLASWGLDSWELDLIGPRAGLPRANSQINIRLALNRLGVDLAYDELASAVLVQRWRGTTAIDLGRLTDSIVDDLWAEIDARYAFRPDIATLRALLGVVARERAYHPVRAYLAAVEPTWDGVARIDTWLVRYGGAVDSPYVRAVGRLVLVAAVRRARSPGCKFDEMLVLEGPQGSGKSSACRALATREGWFVDDFPVTDEQRRTIESIRGAWIVECSELAGVRRGAIETLKASVSRTHDRARLAYARFEEDFARQCVIIGTTNEAEYLVDATGNRRWWPVRIDRFNLDELRRDVDQLWAEAARAESAGESIRLDESLWKVAAEHQEARREVDAFEVALGEALADVADAKLAVSDAWQLLGLGVGDVGQVEMTRVGRAMRRLGWTKKPARRAGKLVKAYVRGEPPEGEEGWLLVQGSRVKRV